MALPYAMGIPYIIYYSNFINLGFISCSYFTQALTFFNYVSS